VLAIDALKWKDCGASNATVHWLDLQISDPIRIKDMRVDAKWVIDKEILPGAYSKLDIWRITRAILVPVHIRIPCVSNFGSCSYDICRKADNDNFCMFQETVAKSTCGCPMTPKTVEGHNYKAKIPDVSSFQSMFVNVIIPVLLSFI